MKSEVKLSFIDEGLSWILNMTIHNKIYKVDNAVKYSYQYR